MNEIERCDEFTTGMLGGLVARRIRQMGGTDLAAIRAGVAAAQAYTAMVRAADLPEDRMLASLDEWIALEGAAS